MSRRNRLDSAATAPAAGDPNNNQHSNANTAKSAMSLEERAQKRLPPKVTRDFHRLLGFPEAFGLGQQPGAAIHLYHELAAPYKKVPPLLAMHFRDLARLQLELQAWEAIRDAEMQDRAEKAEIAASRRRQACHNQ